MSDMAEFEVPAGTQVLVFQPGTGKLEERPLTKQLLFSRQDIRYHAVAHRGWIVLVPAQALGMHQVYKPPQGGV